MSSEGWEALRGRLRAEAARGKMDIDRPVYAEAGRDSLEPLLLGSGSLAAPLGIMGRDPGRHEVLHGEPFVGAGGRLIRDALHQRQHGTPAPSLEAAIQAGRGVFWCNTVPYKPVGNKAWSVAVKRRFVALVAEALVVHWSGHDLITCGREALDWFRLADPALRPAVEAHWQRADRFTASLEVRLQGKAIRLHPLPHPSPLNAMWFKRFPALLEARLVALSG